MQHLTKIGKIDSVVMKERKIKKETEREGDRFLRLFEWSP